MGVKLDFPERSQWFQAGTKPVLPGLYEVRHNGVGVPELLLWTGEHWIFPYTKERVPVSWVYGDEWRGLKEKPDE